MNLFQAHTEWRDRPADERFQSVEALHAAVKARDDASTERRIHLDREIPAVVDGSIAIRTEGGDTLNTTHWASRQLFGRVAVPPDFLATISAPIATAALSDRIRREGLFELRTLVGENGTPVVRAIHGEKYTRLWDSEVTGALLNAGLPKEWRNPVAYEGGKWGAELVPSGLYASDRDMFAFLIDGGDQLDLGGQDQLHRGFIVYNSEVGARSFGWLSFYFRVVCGNNIIWDASGVESIRARHVGGIQSAFTGFEHFLQYLREHPADHDAFAKAVQAAKGEIAVALNGPTEEEVVSDAINVFSKRKFTQAEIIGAARHLLDEESSPTGTRWDWLQGFTAHARELPHIGERVELEQRARKALLVPVK